MNRSLEAVLACGLWPFGATDQSRRNSPFLNFEWGTVRSCNAGLWPAALKAQENDAVCGVGLLAYKGRAKPVSEV